MKRLMSACLIASAIVGWGGVPGLAEEDDAPTEAVTRLVRDLLGGTSGSPSMITSLSASVSSRSVYAWGTADFGGQEFVRVGDDPRGDNLVGDPAGAVGLDIDDLLMAYPSATQPNLVFGIKLAGLTGGGIPEGFLYNWDIAVDGGAAAGGSNWSLRTMRTSQFYQAGNLNPYGGIFECTPTPPTGFSCSEKDRVSVTFDQASSTIAITVPLARIKATAGSTITAWKRNGEPVWIRPSASGGYTSGEPSMDEATHDAYTVPARTVRLGLAPAGTPEGLVQFPVQATVQPTGAFSGTIGAGGPGSYDVWAKACFGESCGTRSVRVSVTSL